MKKILSVLFAALMTSVSFAQATDTIQFQISDAVMTDYIGSAGWFQLRGWSTDGNYYATFSNIDQRSQIAGSYDYSAFDLDYSYLRVVGATDTVKVTVQDGHVSVMATATGYLLEAYYLGEDLHCYHFTMTYTVPVATDTLDVVIPNAELNDLTASNGVFQMVGFNADQSRYAAVAIYSTSVAGSYTDDDFYANYTYLAHLTAADTTYADFYSGNATVSATATGYALEAYLLCDDYVCYHVTMTYTAPVATDTVDVVIPNAELNDLTASNGVFQMVGYNADQSRFASVAIYSSSVAGTYTNDNFYANYTYVAYLTAADTTISEFYSGNATVTATANGYALEAYLLCDDEVCYHVTMTYTTSGINTVSNDQVRVYPNPATDMIHVEANGITRIEVIDLAGRVALTSAQNVNTINVSGLANGVYMLRTTTTEGVNVQKIVKK